MAPTDDIRQEIETMKGAIEVLTDGKWDKSDVAAIATMLSAGGGLLLGLLALLMQLGIIHAGVAPAPAAEPAPVVEAAGSSSSSG